MHEIPNFPFTGPQQIPHSILAQQELGIIVEPPAAHPAEQSAPASNDD